MPSNQQWSREHFEWQKGRDRLRQAERHRQADTGRDRHRKAEIDTEKQIQAEIDTERQR